MKKNELTTAQQKRLGVAALVTALVVMGLLVWLVGVPLVRFASQPERFRDWVDSHGFGGRLAYMGMVILQVVVALIPGALVLAGGAIILAFPRVGAPQTSGQG